MRAFFIIDANSEEITFSKRFLTVESRLQKFLTKPKPEGHNILSRYHQIFQYVPMPDNAIFKLAFSREVISREKLENEKTLMPQMKDYQMDGEDFQQMREATLKQLQHECQKVNYQNESGEPVYHFSNIYSLKVNKQGVTHLWPVVTHKVGNFYLVGIPSVIEDVISQ